jgi:hypothetical protein
MRSFSRAWRIGVVVTGIAAFATSALAQTPAAHKYIGVEKCARCHKAEAKGNQYGQWLKSQHAKAMQTLSTEKAIAIGKEKGLKTPPAENDACVKCHSTGFGADKALFEATFKPVDGVQCEACHGPGSDYKGMTVMKDKAAAVTAGMLVPNEKTCVKCHNAESPTFKSFDFKTAYAKIAHPRPAPAK